MTWTGGLNGVGVGDGTGEGAGKGATAGSGNGGRIGDGVWSKAGTVVDTLDKAGTG